MMMTRFLLVVAIAGCSASEPLVEGPFTGATRRFVVDELRLPLAKADFSADLNGDGRVDNQLANIVIPLASHNNASLGIDDMLASGVLAPVVEITSDDPALRDDSSVGVRFIGVPDGVADQMGARLRDGKLTSNRTRELRVPAGTRLALPLYLDADPTIVDALGLEIELVADGSGGFDGQLRGVLVPDYMTPAFVGFTQMVRARPQEHIQLMAIVDRSVDRDGIVSYDEFANSAILKNVLQPDLDVVDEGGAWRPSPENQAKDSLSFAIAFHLAPCASGLCRAAPPADACRDRALDGDESDIDCGGGCLPCAGNQRCNRDGDCQSGRCESGACVAPSCDDGVRNAFESGVDCGLYCGYCKGTACASLEYCHQGLRCINGRCE